MSPLSLEQSAQEQPQELADGLPSQLVALPGRRRLGALARNVSIGRWGSAMYRAWRGAAWRTGVESSGDCSVWGVVKTRGVLAEGSDMTVAEKKGPRPRYGPRMLQVTAYVRDHPGESSNSLSYATGPYGIRIHGQKAVNRALSASLIEDRGTGRAFEL